MAISYIYGLLVLLGFLVYQPRLLYLKWKTGKKSATLKERFGILDNPIRKEKKRLIWIHAVSMGETRAIAPLAAKLQGEGVQFIVSSGTTTGLAEAKKSIPFASRHILFPLDLPWVMKKLMKQAKPDLILLCEGDFWYNFLHEGKKAGAAIFLVNGKMSEESFKHYFRFPFWAKWIFAPFTKLCLQNNHYFERFQKLGIADEKMVVTGNIKLDHEHPIAPDLVAFRTSLGISEQDPVIVAGSTHAPEEELIVEAIKPLWKTHPTLKLLIVPRHPERFTEVAGLLKKSGVSFKRYSEQSHEPFQVLLMDTMGLLKKCYQLADLAIVGGSFTSKVGGHNILEPCEYGVPVLFGPFMRTQKEFVELCLDYAAGEQVTSETLTSRLQQLFHHREERLAMGERGLKLISDCRGATEKTFKILHLNGDLC